MIAVSRKRDPVFVDRQAAGFRIHHDCSLGGCPVYWTDLARLKGLLAADWIGHEEMHLVVAQVQLTALLYLDLVLPVFLECADSQFP